MRIATLPLGKWLVAPLLALLFGGALPAAAPAHDAASWIGRNPAYVDRGGVHCCGPTDCAVARPGEIERVPGGWRHVPTGTIVFDEDRGVYPSRDVQIWRCVRGGKLRCVFWSAGV